MLDVKIASEQPRDSNSSWISLLAEMIFSKSKLDVTLRHFILFHTVCEMRMRSVCTWPRVTPRRI